MPMLALPLEDYLESGNKSSPRGSSHGLDSLIHRQSRSKRISNWMGYKALGQRWQASNNIGRAVSVAHQGLGYSTQWAWDSGPQQLYVASQPSQAPQGGMVKAAVAHRPDLWVSSAVINAVNGVTPTRTNTSVTHVNLMPEGGTKHVDVGPEKYVEKYSYPGMPSEVPRVAYAVPDGCTIERTANGRALRFLDSEGVQYMHTQDAYGWWGTAEVSLIIPNTGGVDLVPQGTQLILGKTYHIFDLVPVAAEWSESSGEVHIDPSVTISGTTDINDTYIERKFPTDINGGATVIRTANAGATTEERPLIRVDLSSIAIGSIVSSVIWDYTKWNTATVSHTLNMRPCISAWSEATASWNTDSTNISAGILTTGVMESVHATAGSEDIAANAASRAMFDGFIADPSSNYGWAWQSTAAAGNNWNFTASEYSAYTHAYTVFYTAPALGNPHYYYNMLRRRR